MAKKAKAKEGQDQSVDEVLLDSLCSSGGTKLSALDATRYYIDTGNLSLNYICSGRFLDGGIPAGKITEIYGPPGSSKSLIGMSVLSGVQKLGGYAIYLDCEHAINRDFAVAAGHVDENKLIVYEPETLQRVFKKINAVIKAIREVKGPEVPICFVYDSITVSPCEREFRETDLPEDYTDADWKKIVGAKEQPGERARVCGNELRKICPILDSQNATLLIVNQIRDKIGVMFGSPETVGGGGKALEFYDSLRLRTSAQKQIKDTRLETSIGVNIKVRCTKNRSFAPHWETEGIQLYFKNGVNPLGGLLEILRKSERIVSAKAGNYTVVKEYATNPDEDYTFRASKERGDVALEVLLDNPKLLDAESSDAVMQYLERFNNAIALSNSEDVVEEDLASIAELLQTQEE